MPEKSPTPPENASTEAQVGLKIRKLRNQHGFALRTLAERSGLNINTLCLIENGKSSPSVGTLQQLAHALEVPISAFFASEPTSRPVVFTSHGHRPQAEFSRTHLENLGKDFSNSTVQPFLVTLEPGAGSGERMILHSGDEFVYCLSGSVLYTIDGCEYSLQPGDSLLFEAHLPHQWKNSGDAAAQILLTLLPADQREAPGSRHFTDK